jgi:hypothetical protein
MAQATHDVIDDTALPVSPDAVEIRGRRGVHAVLALAAGTVAVAYTWRIGDGASSAWWALVAVLAVVAAVNLAAWLESRAPLLVADEHGVRVRTGRQWAGLPWKQIESVRVERRGKVGDSMLVVVPTGERPEVRVPHGAAARVSTPDLLGALTELRQEHDRLEVAATVVTETQASRIAEATRTAEAAEPPATRIETIDAPEPPAREPVATPRRTSPLSVVATARRAVRAQVHRAGPATVGSSALKHEPSVLPEISELRRTEGKVGLVIETVPAPRTSPVGVPDPVPATAVGAAPVEAYPTQPAPQPLIGPQITAARASLRVSVDQLAERTRIRPHVIESIEVDDFVPCGGDFYARGHLRSLCRTLGIDAAPLLEIYDREYAQAPVAARRVFEAELATGPQAAIRSVSGGPRWSVLLGVVMVLAIVWGAAKIVTDRTAADESTGSDVASLPSLPDDRSGPTGLERVGAPQVSAVRVVAAERTKVEIREPNGTLVWQGTLAASEAHSLDVDGRVTVSVNNGGAAALHVNGNRVGRLGGPGEPAERTVGRIRG